MIDTGYHGIYHSPGMWEPSRHVADIEGEGEAHTLADTLNRRSDAEWDDEDQEYTGPHYFVKPIRLEPVTPHAVELAEGLHPGMDDERLTNWRKVTVYDLAEPLNGAPPPPGTPTRSLNQAECARCRKQFASTHYSGPQKSVELHWKTAECTRRARENKQ
jgi:hypothetical protein